MHIDMLTYIALRHAYRTHILGRDDSKSRDKHSRTQDKQSSLPRTSHIAHTNESWHTHKLAMSHTATSHGTHTNESWRTHK